MKILLISSDSFFAEGLRQLLREMFGVNCSVSILSRDQTPDKGAGVFDVIIIDLMTLTPEASRRLSCTFSGAGGGKIFLVDNCMKGFSCFFSHRMGRMSTEPPRESWRLNSLREVTG